MRDANQEYVKWQLSVPRTFLAKNTFNIKIDYFKLQPYERTPPVNLGSLTARYIVLRHLFTFCLLLFISFVALT